MILDDYLLLPILFIIGFITSYEDYKEGKIRNKWILLGMSWALAVYFILFLWGIASPLIVKYVYQNQPPLGTGGWLAFDFNYFYLGKVFLNGAISAVVGYLMWYFEVWSPGDAKLFTVFSLLLPLKYYLNSFVSIFPSFPMVLNMFVLLFLFIFMQSCLYFIKKILLIPGKSAFILSRYAALKNAFSKNWKSYLTIVFGFIVFFILLQVARIDLMRKFAFFQYANLILFLVFLVLAKQAGNFFKNQKMNFLMLFLLAVYLLIRMKVHLVPEFNLIIIGILKSGLIFMVLLAFMTIATNQYIKKTTQNIPFAFWMFMGAIITILFAGSPVFKLLTWLQY